MLPLCSSGCVYSLFSKHNIVASATGPLSAPAPESVLGGSVQTPVLSTSVSGPTQMLGTLWCTCGPAIVVGPHSFSLRELLPATPMQVPLESNTCKVTTYNVGDDPEPAPMPCMQSRTSSSEAASTPSNTPGMQVGGLSHRHRWSFTAAPTSYSTKPMRCLLPALCGPSPSRGCPLQFQLWHHRGLLHIVVRWHPTPEQDWGHPCLGAWRCVCPQCHAKPSQDDASRHTPDAIRRYVYPFHCHALSLTSVLRQVTHRRWVLILSVETIEKLDKRLHPRAHVHALNTHAHDPSSPRLRHPRACPRP